MAREKKRILKLNMRGALCKTMDSQLLVKEFQYEIMIEERVIHEIRIDKATGRGDSDSPMTCFEVIMPLKLKSTNIYIYIYIYIYI